MIGDSVLLRGVIRAAGASHPDRIRVLDWIAFSRGHRGWFYGDGLHLTPHGARAYLRLLRRVVGEAGNGAG